MATINAKIDMVKLRRDVEREIKRFAKQGVQDLSPQERQYIGEDMIDLMKDFISKGISPIQGWGRFPAYKGTEREAQVRAGQRRAKKGASKQLKRALRLQRASAVAQKKTRYPYNVMGKFPNKRERPVNLFLSGDFMDDLVARATSVGLTIGFWAKKSVDKEKGHRTGANGQRLRPIIPNDSETFTRPIYQRLLQSLKVRLLRSLESTAKKT